MQNGWITDNNSIKKRLENIRALIFDWDGVFNAGQKGVGMPSSFTEADSMGTNMLRFAFWLRSGNMPKMAIITGAENPTAISWAEREHIQAVYSKVPDKEKALAHFCSENDLKPEQCVFFYDDLLDLSVAASTSIRMAMFRPNCPSFYSYLIQQNLADYISHNSSGNFALREACEALLEKMGMWEEIAKKRTAFSGDYESYINTRKLVNPQFFSVKDL